MNAASIHRGGGGIAGASVGGHLPGGQMSTYKVLEKRGILVRAGFDMKSAETGNLKAGEVVKALEQRKNPKGIVRVRFKGRVSGWASLTAGDGSTLLEAMEPDTESESGSETGSEYTDVSSTEASESDGSEYTDESSGVSSDEDPPPRKAPAPAKALLAGKVFVVHEKQGVLARAGFVMTSAPAGKLRHQERSVLPIPRAAYPPTSSLSSCAEPCVATRAQGHLYRVEGAAHRSHADPIQRQAGGLGQPQGG